MRVANEPVARRAVAALVSVLHLRATKHSSSVSLRSWTTSTLIRLMLEAYYEPQFSSFSHGFRPGRGCHTALSSITDNWSGTKWFIEGDISHYFDTIDHSVLLAILGEKLKDNRFLRWLANLLRAGYLEDWK
jgi:retron-type reverse transcriptase